MTMLLWVAGLLVSAGPLLADAPSAETGQSEGPPSSVSHPGEFQRYSTVVVQADPVGTVVALTLHLPVGSAADPEGREGTATLLGRAVEDILNARLQDRESQVSVHVGEHDLALTLTTPPDGWHFPLEEARDVLLNRSFSSGEIDRVRQLQMQRLVFEEGAPVRIFQVERMGLIQGIDSPAARPMSGSRESLERITADDLGAFQTTHLRPTSPVLAIVGPVDRDEVARRLSVEPTVASATSFFRDAAGSTTGNQRATSDTTAPLEDPAPTIRTRLSRELDPPLSVARSGAMAWISGDRRLRNMELTSTWMAIAWPFPESTPETLLDFLAHNLHEALVPSPPDPGLYGAEVDIHQVDGRPIVVASVTVDPRVALRWEERTLERMSALAQSPPEGSFFELTRRRYRNRLLLQLSDPVNRSRQLADEVARTGAIRDLQAHIWRLTREGLSDLAASAGEPRVFLLGPVEMMEGAAR